MPVLIDALRDSPEH